MRVVFWLVLVCSSKRLALSLDVVGVQLSVGTRGSNPFIWGWVWEQPKAIEPRSTLASCVLIQSYSGHPLDDTTINRGSPTQPNFKGYGKTDSGMPGVLSSPLTFNPHLSIQSMMMMKKKNNKGQWIICTDFGLKYPHVPGLVFYSAQTVPLFVTL